LKGDITLFGKGADGVAERNYCRRDVRSSRRRSIRMCLRWWGERMVLAGENESRRRRLERFDDVGSPHDNDFGLFIMRNVVALV
jgi:hypothetical protein